MDRRNAIAIAIAVGGTVLASGAAFAANVGLLQENDDPVGQLETSNVSDLVDDTTTTTGAPQTIVIDVPVSGGVIVPGPVSGSVDDDGTPDQGHGDAGTVSGGTVTGGYDDDSDDESDDEYESHDDDSDDGSDDHGGEVDDDVDDD